MRLTPIPILLGLFIAALGLSAMFPLVESVRPSGRRSACQNNLKQIGLAMLHYTQDYDERFPAARLSSSGGWPEVMQPYIKPTQLFQCPAALVVPEKANDFSSDYFYNRHLAQIAQDKITQPKNTLLAGDSNNNAPLRASQTRLAADVIINPDSPARRHLDTANYLSADGHVKYLASQNVTRNLWQIKQ